MSLDTLNRSGLAMLGEGDTSPVNRLGAALDRMVAIQADAYPVGWSDADKREMAERHLFGWAAA